jgi:hypothetical protein
MVRLIGLALIGFGLADAFGSLLGAVGLPSGRYYSAWDRAAAAAAYALSCLVFMLAANAITRLIYGRGA